MAYDGYRGHPPQQPDPYQSQYSAYEHDDYPDPRNYASANYNPSQYSSQQPPLSPRSRASSNPRSDTSQQPVYDAVNNAFEKSDAASQVDPALIAQITEQVRRQVINDLKAGGIPIQQQPQQPYVTRSPTVSTTASFPSRNVYTPPSPTRHDFSSNGSDSPDRPHAEPVFSPSEDLPTPKYRDDKPTLTQGAYNESSRARPAPSTRIVSDPEATTLEKIWQPLFDSEGQPTHRLGQFLRGLAIHIVCRVITHTYQQ